LKQSLEKVTVRSIGARTKTDTGVRGEYPKAFELSISKELGILTP